MGQNDSFRYPDPKQIKIEDARIFLPKAGWTRMVIHRPIDGKVKNVTVYQGADKIRIEGSPSFVLNDGDN